MQHRRQAGNNSGYGDGGTVVQVEAATEQTPAGEGEDPRYGQVHRRCVCRRYQPSGRAALEDGLIALALPLDAIRARGQSKRVYAFLADALVDHVVRPGAGVGKGRVDRKYDSYRCFDYIRTCLPRFNDRSYFEHPGVANRRHDQDHGGRCNSFIFINNSA